MMMTATEVIYNYRTTGKELIDTIEQSHEDHCNTVPFTGSWTVGEVADHLRKSMATWTLFKGRTSVAHRKPDEKCQALSDLFLNFDLKFPTADFIAPSAGPHDKTDQVDAIQFIIDECSHYAERHDLDLLCMEFEFPGFGHLTRLEWLHFYAVHGQRHIRQIKNILSIILPPSGTTANPVGHG